MPEEADDFDWVVGEIKQKIADIRAQLEADTRYQAHQERTKPRTQ
jgi:hypothetical protein